MQEYAAQLPVSTLCVLHDVHLMPRAGSMRCGSSPIAASSVSQRRFWAKRRIGTGGHARVLEATNAIGASVALKVSAIEDPANVRELAAMSVLTRFKHPNVVHALMLPFCVTTPAGRQLCQVFELCDGDLLSLVDRCGGCLDEATARRVFRQVVSGVVHCHDNNVFHMDIKPDNILLHGEVAKLADFGSAVVGQSTQSPCGTLEYACPEALAAHQTGDSICANKADVWALGISIVACVLGFFPWDAAVPSDDVFVAWCDAWTRVRAVDKADDNDRRTCGSVSEAASHALGRLLLSCCERPVSVELRQLLVAMLDPVASSRISMAEVHQHQWLADRAHC